MQPSFNKDRRVLQKPQLYFRMFSEAYLYIFSSHLLSVCKKLAPPNSLQLSSKMNIVFTDTVTEEYEAGL